MNHVEGLKVLIWWLSSLRLLWQCTHWVMVSHPILSNFGGGKQVPPPCSSDPENNFLLAFWFKTEILSNFEYFNWSHHDPLALIWYYLGYLYLPLRFLLLFVSHLLFTVQVGHFKWQFCTPWQFQLCKLKMLWEKIL